MYRFLLPVLFCLAFLSLPYGVRCQNSVSASADDTRPKKRERGRQQQPPPPLEASPIGKALVVDIIPRQQQLPPPLEARQEAERREQEARERERQRPEEQRRLQQEAYERQQERQREAEDRRQEANQRIINGSFDNIQQRQQNLNQTLDTFTKGMTDIFQQQMERENTREAARQQKDADLEEREREDEEWHRRTMERLEQTQAYYNEHPDYHGSPPGDPIPTLFDASPSYNSQPADTPPPPLAPTPMLRSLSSFLQGDNQAAASTPQPSTTSTATPTQTLAAMLDDATSAAPRNPVIGDNDIVKAAAGLFDAARDKLAERFYGQPGAESDISPGRVLARDWLADKFQDFMQNVRRKALTGKSMEEIPEEQRLYEGLWDEGTRKINPYSVNSGVKLNEKMSSLLDRAVNPPEEQ